MPAHKFGADRKKVLFVHPSCLMYSEVYLRLEPLGLEIVAESARRAGNAVRMLDLQVDTQHDYFRLIDDWQPDAIGFSLNYLANVPEVVDLAKETRRRLPSCFVFAGGHSASFIADEILQHGGGAIDCVVRGEGEEVTPQILDRIDHPASLPALPGVVTQCGRGPSPKLVESLDAVTPARSLLRHRRKYFIGVLDPAGSIEFTRGCPWDCVFCSAWTFYGRSYRHRDPEAIAKEIARIREPGIFIVDDVAFIRAEHGFAIGRELEKRNIRKRYYLETRGDVLLRNKDVFRYWRRLGLEYMFLGLEAIDDEGLKLYRKRVTLNKNFEALEFARSLGIAVAINIIADPGWDEQRFTAVREWALSVPEIVHMTVNTPYPGTETWLTESRSLSSYDYRLFDVQHAVLPTRMPLERFYEELVKTQQVLNRKHLGWSALKHTSTIAARHLLRGQTNFVRMLWKFSQVYNAERQIRDHQRFVKYQIELPRVAASNAGRDSIFVHARWAAQPSRHQRQAS